MTAIPNVSANFYGAPSNQQMVVGQPCLVPQQGMVAMPQMMFGIQYVYVEDPMVELNSCTSVLIKQQAEFLEAMFGCETANRYHVFGQTPQGFKALFKCREKSNWCMRNCFPSNQREFNMEIEHITFNQILNPFATAYKPFKCTFCCFCRPELMVTLNSLGSVGTVFHEWSLCDPLFNVYDGNKQLKYVVTANCCQCGLLCANNICGKLSEAHFSILIPGTQTEVGKIIKESASSFSEVLTDADNYQIFFPPDANASDKLLLIALGLMIDYQYFETDAGNKHNKKRRH